ncbi:MAG: general secretion pathway protein GspD [Colwellia sp.]|nr:MAG: general secretion pathway protein GspD [Colwellia sp.]
MKQLILIVQIICLLLLSQSVIAAAKVKEIEFNNTNLIDVVRILSELSNSNIIATPAATKKKVTIHLKNITVKNALKSISRITDLWFRFDDDTNTYRLMTREEYAKDLVIRESEHIEIFKVRNANVRIIAQSIEDLYGSRVILSLGEQIEGGSNSSSRNSTNSNSNRSSNNVRNSRSTNNNRSSRSDNNSTSNSTNKSFDTSELTIDQFELLSQKMTGATTLNAQVLEQVSAQVQPIYITVNNEHSMIIVRTDDKTVLKAIKYLVKKTDIAVPQVMLEMKIISITLGDDFTSIFNFELQPSGNNQSIRPIKLGNNALPNSGSIIYEFLNTRLRANIEFLEKNKRIKVLSNPMVLASNHRQTELFIGEESLLVRGFTFNPATIDNGIVISPSFIETETELQEIGITLRIVPRINADNTVALALEQESSEINPGGASLPISDGAGGILNLPVDTVNSSRLTGTVVAKNNLTVAVGGLIRHKKSSNIQKVPILSEIPILGNIFKSTVESEQETEIVLLITPRILVRSSESERIRKTDNRFYQDLNRGHPDTVPFENKFIGKKAPITKLPPQVNKQQLYMNMSQYAADMIRIPNIERIRSKNYQPVRFSNADINTLFNNANFNTKAVASWERDGMFVTVVEVINTAEKSVTVDYQHIAGRWLASSIENSNLAPKGNTNDRTYMYLISTLSFEESLANGQ